MSEENPYSVSIPVFGKMLGISYTTARRVIYGTNPPPLIDFNGRTRVAIGAPEFDAWLKARTQVTPFKAR